MTVVVHHACVSFRSLPGRMRRDMVWMHRLLLCARCSSKTAAGSGDVAKASGFKRSCPRSPKRRSRRNQPLTAVAQTQSSAARVGVRPGRTETAAKKTLQAARPTEARSRHCCARAGKLASTAPAEGRTSFCTRRALPSRASMLQTGGLEKSRCLGILPGAAAASRGGTRTRRGISEK